jgi:hypothetical protein
MTSSVSFLTVCGLEVLDFRTCEQPTRLCLITCLKGHILHVAFAIFPLNRVLLLHKDIAEEPPEEDLNKLNLSGGMAGTTVDKLVQHAMRNGGTERRQARLEEGENVKANLLSTGRITSGLMCSNAVHSLSDPSLLAAFRAREATRRENAEKERRKERRVKRERIAAMAELRGRKPAMVNWSLKECAIFLQYKKQDTDAKMPTKVADRRKRCQEITHRPSPCCSPHASDDEDEENSGDNIVFDTSSIAQDNIIDEAVIQSI